MAALLIIIASVYGGVGLNRALAYAKSERHALQILIADPSPAVGSALQIKSSFGKLPAWKRRSLVAEGSQESR
jgi:hypothetical protein